MTLPTLTAQQQLQNSVNGLVTFIQQIGSAQGPQGVVAAYNRIYNTLFANPNGTSTQTLTQLETSAVSILSDLTALATCALTINPDVVLGAIPAYTANSDGTVTLT